MRLYTYQLAHHRRLVKGSIPLLDTTVKSGDPRLAPTWEMVMGHKKGTLSNEEYTDWYRKRLDHFWFHDPDFFAWLLSHDELALGCYCKAGNFCHRYLLVDFLKEVCGAKYVDELC